MKSNLPTLVLAVYNRKEPMLRLLESLLNAKFPEQDVNMVISIDNDNNKNQDVVKAAQEFNWKFGKKEVIYHPENLGIRNHFNFCGNLTEKYETVIFLEDDLFVSPYFYQYALQALDFFKDEENVAGISLFSYNRIEQWENPLPFTAIDDGADNYFLQQASWGQIWTKRMWAPFKEWFAINGKPEIVNSLDELPLTVKGWPATSWKKYYISYMILHKKYYVFPRIALATNFDDVGVNRKSETLYYQSPILISEKKFLFTPFQDSLSIYDSYFEILPEILKKLNPALSSYSFDVNLYGSKRSENMKHELILSKSPGKNSLKSYKLAMKPHELNIVFDREGDDIFLCRPEDINDLDSDQILVTNFSFFYRNLFTFKEIARIVKYKLKNKLRKKS